tara:strand:+ start:330 stop:488 length:159 start_codon:yes stop_codon:yes gene_type:complete
MRLKSIQKNPHNYGHNLGQTYNNIPPGYMFAGLSMGGMLLTGGLIALLVLRK